MTPIVVTRTLDRPVDEVWAALEDISRHVEWMADAESITFVGERRSGVGTRFECVTRVGPLRTTDIMEITEWTPPRAMGVRHEGAVTGEGRFALEPLDGGRSRLRWDEELVFPWWLGGRLGEIVGRPVLTRVWRANLRRLAAIVENGAGGSKA